jgi:hypothetical protein
MGQGPVWTYIQAGVATNTLYTQPLDLRPWGYTLWVVAPDTLQAAAFEKDSSPYARSIFGGHPLDVQDNTMQYIGAVSFVHDIREQLKNM